jgi:hypothetical protein
MAMLTSGTSVSGGLSMERGGLAGGPSGSGANGGDDAANVGTSTGLSEAGGAPGTHIGTLTFTKKTLHMFNYAEGIGVGDFNNDGKIDVNSGPFWWEGPDFSKQHQFFPPPPNNAYTGMTLGDWADYAYDVDGDGWVDSINVMRPGTPSYWYKNPGMPTVEADVSTWEKHEIGILTFEQSAFADISGDGKPDLVVGVPDAIGYLEMNPTGLWPFTLVQSVPPANGVSLDVAWPWWHGIGAGDLDGDGKLDFLEANGWWSRMGGTAAVPWVSHPVAFKGDGLPVDRGPSQMFAYDVNGDGQTDVVCSFDAHGYGVGWFEQNKGTFIRHEIVGPPGFMNVGGIPSFSQPHALFLTDVDGDGLKDIIAGKSFYAHPPGMGDPDADGTPVFYVFRLIRGAQGVTWEPHLVDSVEGLGRQFTATDLNGDGLVDIAVASKHGAFLFFQQ